MNIQTVVMKISRKRDINFKFIFDLDTDYATRFFESIGYHGVDLGEKK